MQAFWWFEEGAIAGMARPGFNAVHWFDLSLEEGILLGWLGQYSSGPAPLAAFREHLSTYAPRVFPFFRVSPEQGASAMRVFDAEDGLLAVACRLGERTETFTDFSARDDQLFFRLNEKRMASEIARLKELGVRRIVSLTEHHHQRDELAAHFALHHFSIADLGAPLPEHARGLAEILRRARIDGETVAVHCLAGIGRTSTMLLAAHLVLGEGLDKLQGTIAKRNPHYVLTGSQGEFVKAVAAIHARA